MTHFILFLSFPLLGFFGGESNLSDITNAIQKGDAATLSTYFDQSVELEVLDKTAQCSPKQAVQMMELFFQQHQPQAFSQVHHGKSSTNKTTYCIGNLRTASETFRVYIYLSAQKRIHELRFEQE